MFTLLIVTFIAGVVGTGLGGFIGVLFKKDSNRTISLLLAFAAGVMLSIVCFDLIEGAIATGIDIIYTVLSIILGVVIVYILNYLIDNKFNKEVPHITNDHPETHDDIDELIHADHYNEHVKNKDSKLSLFVAGIVMACAIALHNIPEGMTIGASYIYNDASLNGSALTIALLIGFHNIPEGMAVSVPLVSGGMQRSKAVILSALSGFPTVIGAILGYLVGDIGSFGLMLSLSLASGAMLYVVFGEILPQSILMYKSKLPSFALIIGMLLGLLLIY